MRSLLSFVRRLFTRQGVERLSRVAFIGGAVVLVFAYGYAASALRWFPSRYIEHARRTLATLEEKPIFYVPLPKPLPPSPPGASARAQPGLNLVTQIIGHDRLSVRLMDMNRHVIHEWNPDWFKLWPDAKHVPESALPKSEPGTHVHGAFLTPEGDLIFSFENLGLVRVDPCGKLVWRLPYRTHHSIFADDDGTLWIPGHRDQKKRVPWLPAWDPPFLEPTALQVSQDGKILREIPLLKVLYDDGYLGLLVIRAPFVASPHVTGNPLHLNDVEVFPGHLQPGYFSHGDLLVSMRDIHSVFVFDGTTLKVKFASIGRLVAQHDPDFVDGNTLQVFDNNTQSSHHAGLMTKIVRISVPDGRERVVYTGTPAHPFFTYKMGKQQLLANGDLLLTETFSGRAFEVAPDGQVVWSYTNQVDAEHVGIVEEVERLPASAGKPFENGRMQKRCGAKAPG